MLIFFPMNSDSFNKREAASENYYVKQKEKEKSVFSTNP